MYNAANSTPLSPLWPSRDDRNNPYIQARELLVIEHSPALRHTHLQPLLQARYKLTMLTKDSVSTSRDLGQPDAVVLELATSRYAVTPCTEDVQLIQKLRNSPDLKSVPLFLVTDISAWIYLERLSYKYWPVVIVDRSGSGYELQYKIDSYFHRHQHPEDQQLPDTPSRTFCCSSLTASSRTFSIVDNPDILLG